MDSKELNSFSFVQHPQIQLTERVVLTESYCSTVLTMFFSYDIVFMHVSGSVHAKKNATTFLIFTSETTLLRDSATRKEVLKTSWKTSMEFDIVLCFDLSSILS